MVKAVNFPARLETAQDLPAIFEVVKLASGQDLGYTRGGLMLALADLGNHPSGFIGAWGLADGYLNILPALFIDAAGNPVRLRILVTMDGE